VNIAAHCCVFRHTAGYSQSVVSQGNTDQWLVIRMGTIVSRRRRSGTDAHMAKIIIKREGKVVLRESKTFDRKPAACAWINRREDELSEPGALERAITQSKNAASPSPTDAIDEYVSTSRKEIGKTKAQAPNTINADYEIAELDCDKIGSAKIVDFAKSINAKMGPQTDGRQLSIAPFLNLLYRTARVGLSIGLQGHARRTNLMPPSRLCRQVQKPRPATKVRGARPHHGTFS